MLSWTVEKERITILLHQKWTMKSNCHIIWKIIRETKNMSYYVNPTSSKRFQCCLQKFSILNSLSPWLYFYFLFFLLLYSYNSRYYHYYYCYCYLEQSLKKKRNKDFYQRIFKFYSYCSFLIWINKTVLFCFIIVYYFIWFYYILYL